MTLWYSFQNYFWNEPGGAHWTGISNYKEVFTDPNFRSALWRSVTMTAIAVIFAMALGIALAVLLDKKFLGRGVVRTLIITPFLVMPAAAALIWAGPMLDPNFGLLNWLLEPFGVNHVAWLTTHAYGSVIVVMIWQWTPFMTLIVLAGLQGQAVGRRSRRPRSTGPTRGRPSASSPCRTCARTSSSASCSARSTW